ncbi:MAG: sensor histidine kinase [Acidobacteriaceae bacterium]|nr:sensor histidine kinase [Acidobacteriaceae bacterium]
MAGQKTSKRISRSPTVRLLVGLLVTLLAVTGFSSFSLRQLSGLRRLQAQIIDQNRHDSLLLLQVQNDLNAVGLRLRDMIQDPQNRRILEFRPEFERLRADLEESIREEARLAPVTRRAERQAELLSLLREFRATSDLVFEEASRGNEAAAASLAATRLSAQQSALGDLVLHLLERNNEAEERADQKVAEIYEAGGRNIYAFQAGCMVTILITSLYLIYSNRGMFEKIESLSKQRRVLAARLITVQEEVLRSVSRELHDEFGQILTAVSAMLSRAERKGVPPDSPLRTELSEIREITHSTLEKMRSLSQMLHPSVIDDYGLEKGIQWYVRVFERQTGIETTAKTTGVPVRITGPPAIHAFRIVQEALNNAAKHSKTTRAQVEMIFSTNDLTVKVQDFGKGFSATKKSGKPGLGFVAMRERAELLGGTLDIKSIPDEGTTISVSMPLQQEDLILEESMREVAIP